MPTATETPRVAFNLMSARVGGGLTYAISQTRAFLEIWPHDRIVVLTSPWNDDAFRQELSHPTVCLPARTALHRYLLEQTLSPGLLRKERIDVLYGIGNFLPLTPSRCRTVMTLQNPNYVGEGRRLHHNRTLAERIRRGLSHTSMKRADLVITISQSLEAALRTERTLRKVKTKVILSGGPDWSDVVAEPALPSHVCSAPFFLSVANDYPHKRLDDIAQAFAMAAAPPHPESYLVFVGGIDRLRQQSLRAHASCVADRLIFLGSVGDRGRIKWLYEHARAAVSASELEAFPLTPAEAASLRCPLILTDIPPHLEVANGAGVHFKTGDRARLTQHLQDALDDQNRVPAPIWRWPTSWGDNAGELAAALRLVGRASSGG